MPTVQYQPDQVRTQVAGTTTARAVDNGGQQLAQGINSLAKMAGEMQNQATVAETQQAATQFEREKNKIFFDPDNGYFNTSGRNAYEMAGETTKRLEQLKADYGKTLSPRAQAEFNRVADSQLTRANMDIMSHSSKNLKAWQQSNIEAEVENSLENSSLYWNNMKQLNIQRELGRQSVLEAAKMSGLSPQATNEKLQNYNSAFAMNTIKAAAQKSAADGDKAMELYGDNLEGPDKVNISEMLTKRREVEDTKAKAGEAVLRSNNLVATYGDRVDARTAMTEDINKIEDPEMQKLVKVEATYQLNQKLAADQEERANISVMAQEFMMRPGQSIQGFKAQYSDEWAKLRPAERSALESAVKVKTDFVTFTKLRGMDPDELAKIDPVEYINKLAEPEYKQLLTLWSDARKPGSDKSARQPGRTQAKQTTDVISNLFGEEKNWNDDRRAKVELFHEMLDGEITMLEKAKGSSLTSAEFTDTLNNLVRVKTIEGGGMFWGDSELSLEDFEVEELEVFPQILQSKGLSATTENLYRMRSYDISNIPKAQVDQLSDYLMKNNKPVNVQTIYEAYQQARVK